ncbi:MAG: NACHT domain-containing protein, partial [Symploca sp. SIO1C2]|nr:NACHT domain-containing protein [Symploca sp. SIO1C2]
GIDQKYVPLACIKEEIDPVTRQRLGISRYDEQDGWIDGYIDLWLADPAKEHISILGEFGTGKTWFALHYAWQVLQDYRNAQQRGLERPRLPLVIPLRDYAKAVSVESLFSEFFFRKHEIPIPGYSAFEQLNRMGKLLLIFDGFDEMADRVNRQQMINNFWELAKVVVPGAKVILTCRTEHFPEAKEGRALLNAELQASTRDLTGETPQFEVLELEKFNDEQIRQVLSFQAQPATVEQIMGNPQLLDLARRPVLTELILEALPDIEAGKPVDMSRVYLYAVRHKMERDIKAERTFTSMADKLYFLCELSWEMLSTDRMSINYREFPVRIRKLFGAAVEEEKALDHWHYDMMGQTMLIRNAEGDYTPAHRSLLEFFVAYKFAAELGVLADDFTELAQVQSGLNENAAPQDYTWSDYFQRQVDQNGKVVAIAPLKGFVSESLTLLRHTVGQGVLTKAVMDLIVPMLDKGARRCAPTEGEQSVKNSLLGILETTRGKTEDEVGYVGGNAATLLVKVDQNAIAGRNLSRALIKGADLANAILHNVNFAEANLANSVFSKIFGSVLSVAFSPDGKILATGYSNGIIDLQPLSDSEQIVSCSGHTNWVRSVCFSPDGQTLASCSDDCSVRLWNVNTGECFKILSAHTDRVESICFRPDGQTLASCSGDCSVKLWNVNTGECLKTFLAHTNRVKSICFSLDGQTLASCSDDCSVKLWNVNTGECLKTFLAHVDLVESICFSPDGQTLASASKDCNVKLWNVSTGKCLKTLLGHTRRVWSVTFSPDGQTLISSSGDYTIRVWNIKTGRCLKILSGHTNFVRSVSFNFSPNSQILASGSDDHTVKLWDVTSGECLKTLQGYSNEIYSVAFSSQGMVLASGHEDNTVRVWDCNTGECLQTLQGHVSLIWSVAFSHYSRVLASGANDDKVKLWDVNTGQCINTLLANKKAVFSTTFSCDGRTLAIGTEDYAVELWDVSTGKLLKSWQEHSRFVSSVAFSSQGMILASSSEDETIRLWDVNNAQCLKTLRGHIGSVNSVTFSPDGYTLASGGQDQTIKLWDVQIGECLKTWQGHTGFIKSVAFSPQGNILASGSADKTVKLWDISTGKCLNSLQGHTSSVESVAFSADAKTLASGSRDGTIKLWDIKTGECLKTLRSPRPYEGMKITGVAGLTETEKTSLKALGAVD